MNLREIELFGTLMRVGTTTETARLLGISQPGVSAQLKRLETTLGVSLFHRTGNRLLPTREANEIFAMAAPIFTTYADIRAKIPELRHLAERGVSISATPALVEGFIGPILIKAGYKNWKKRLNLKVNSPENDLRRGEADIGLQMALPPKAEFQAHSVGCCKLVAVVKEDHPLTQKDELFCKDISEHPLVCYNADWSPMGATIRSAFDSQGLHYNPACTVPFCANVCDMVRACGGVGIVDDITAREYVMRGLKARPITDIAAIDIIAFHRRNEPLRGPTQDFLTALLQSSGTHLHPKSSARPNKK
jgi:DNA-binding transcriptional LysR family regulator